MDTLSRLQTPDFRHLTKTPINAKTLFQTRLARPMLILTVTMKAKLNELKAGVVELTCFALFIALEIMVIYYTFRFFGAIK
jgi:hypothetical protein